MIYLWIKNNRVYTEPNRELAELNYGITEEPTREFTDDEWAEVNGLARIIDDELFLGYTDEEKKEQKEHKLISEMFELKHKLTATDYITAKLAEGVATKEEYAEQLAERAEWRARINEIEEILGE